MDNAAAVKGREKERSSTSSSSCNSITVTEQPNSIKKVAFETISEILAEFRNWYSLHIINGKWENVSEIVNFATAAVNQVEGLYASLPQKWEIDTALDSLTFTLSNMGYLVPKKIRKQMKLQQRKFIQAAESFNIINYDEADDLILELKLKDSLHSLLSYLNNIRDWYEFCEDLEKSLKTYKWQQDKPLPPSTTEVKWLDFLETEWQYPVPRKVRRIEQSIPAEHTKFLEDIILFAAKPIEFDFEGMTVSGNFIKLSEIYDENGLPKIEGLRDKNHIEIYATLTIFVDTNIDSTKQQSSLVLIAPNLVVIQKERCIDLSGNDAENPHPEKAANGSTSRLFIHSPHGMNGNPGMSGHPGGSFLGIFQFGVNIDSLTIRSNGGKGGNGQHGGDGAAGNGGNGGNGGAAGKGGQPGTVNIIMSMENQVFHKLITEAGEDGNPGEGGRAGSRRLMGKDHRIFWGKPGAKGGHPVEDTEAHPNCNIVEWKSILKYKWSAYRYLGNHEISEFFTFMETEPKLKRYFGAQSCIEQMLHLQKFNDLPKENLTQLFSNFLFQMECFLSGSLSHSELAEEINDFKKVGAYLATISHSKLSLLNDYYGSSVVVDVSRYFNVVKERMEHFKENSALVAVAEAQAKFESAMQKKIQITKAIQSEEIQPLLAEVEKELEERLKSLASQFVKLTKDAESNLAQAKSQLKKAKETIGWKIAFQWIANVVGLTTTIFTGSIGTTGKVMAALTPASNFLLKSLSNDGSSVAGEDGLQNSWAEVTKMAERTKIFSDNVKQTINKTKVEINPATEASIKATYFLGETIANAMFKAAQSDNEIQKLQQIVQEAEIILQDVKNRDKLMQEVFIPSVDSALSAFESILDHSSEDQRHARLHSSKLKLGQFKISRMLTELKQNLDQISLGLETQTFLNVMDKVHEYLALMISLFEDIERFQDTKMLGNYLAVLNSSGFQQIQVSNPILAASLAQLKKMNTANLFMVEDRRALHALKQWVFPFGKIYLTEDLEVINNNEEINPEDLAAVYSEQVRRIQLELEKYKSTVLDLHDTNLIHTTFAYGFVSSRPFFTWRNSEWHPLITKLLSGDTVELKADIRLSPRGRDAIKFQQIELVLVIPEEKKTSTENQEVLDLTLNHFGVLLTHSGVSSYRFDGSFYTIYGENKTIQYNFERDQANGNRLGSNRVNEKFKSGDCLLSPYTTWTIQLIRVSNNNALGEGGGGAMNFEMLERFATLVDLHLVGTGIYVDSQRLKEDLEVDKYYQGDESICVIDDKN